MSDTSQDSSKSLPPETSTSSEAQRDQAATLDDELVLARQLTGSELANFASLVGQIRRESTTERTLNEAKSDSQWGVLKDAIGRLRESKKKESELLKNNIKLEEETKRMQENEKLFSSELQKLLSSLKMVKPSVATLNEDDPTAIFRAIREYLNDRKNQESSSSKKIALLETQKQKLSKDLDVAKSNLEQANQDASSARDEANKRLLELKDNLEDAERSVETHRDRATEWGKVIDETKNAISHIKLPQEIVSLDIDRKVMWLADEHKKTCKDLGSAKADLELTHKELDKRTLEKKKISEDLDTTKLNLEQANLQASRELSAMEVNLEQVKTELDERCAELKAAELKVRELEELKHVISPINFPEETQPMDTLTSIKWLADYYKNFADSIRSSNQEETKRFLINMKANIRRKIADELSERIRVIVEAAVEEATGVEDPNPGASSLEIVPDASHTEAMAAELKVRELEEIKHIISTINFPEEIQPMDTLTSVKWLADYYENFADSICVSNQEETERFLINMKANIHQKIVDELPERIRVIVETAVKEATGVEDPNHGASSSEIVPDTSHTEPMNIIGATTIEQDTTKDVGQHSGSGKGTIVETVKEAAREVEGSNPEASSSAIVAYSSHRELEESRSGTSSNVQDVAPVEQYFGSGERTTNEYLPYQQQQAVPPHLESIIPPLAYQTGVRPLYTYSQHVQFMYQHHRQQQPQALPQPPGSTTHPQSFYTGVGPGFGYSPNQQQQEQLGGDYYFYDDRGTLWYMPIYYTGRGSV